MYRYGCVPAVVILAALLAAPSGAGDKKKAGPVFPEVKLGPEHKVLGTLVGVFDAKVKMYLDPTKPANESTGVMTRKMIIGGNYLQESFEGKFFGKKFTGLGIVGFDAVKKKYVTTWCDSMSTSITLFHGSYDPDKKTLTNVGEDYSPDGKKMKARDVLKILSADEQVFDMYRQPEGEKAEFKVMEIRYKRAK